MSTPPKNPALPAKERRPWRTVIEQREVDNKHDALVRLYNDVLRAGRIDHDSCVAVETTDKVRVVLVVECTKRQLEDYLNRPRSLLDGF